MECFDSRWGVEKGNLGNGLGDYLPKWDFPLERGISVISGDVTLSGNS